MRVVLADRHQIVRVGLRSILDQQGDIHVVGEAGTGHATLLMVARERPDIAIIDPDLPDLGLSTMPSLLTAAPGLRVLLLSTREDTEIVRSSLASGAHGYLSKVAGPDEVVRAVRSLAAGRSFFSVPLEPRRPGELLAFEDDKPEIRAIVPPKVARPLSAREQQVLELFALGHTHKQIADILGVRAKTVETYRGRLGDKFGVRSLAELVCSARELGVLSARESFRWMKCNHILRWDKEGIDTHVWIVTIYTPNHAHPGPKAQPADDLRRKRALQNGSS